MKERVCPECEKYGKTTEIEDLPHHIWRCGSTEGERETMMEKLEWVYPGIQDGMKKMGDDEERTRALIWEVPDGRYSGVRGKGKTAKEARVAATKAVLEFLDNGHTKHAVLKKTYRPYER